jgi:hypothetical protein
MCTMTPMRAGQVYRRGPGHTRLVEIGSDARGGVRSAAQLIGLRRFKMKYVGFFAARFAARSSLPDYHLL